MEQRSTDRRGQTPADYIIGISLLLVTIVGVFAFVPTVFEPFEQPSTPDEQAMAERLSEDLIQNHTFPDKERTLNVTKLGESISGLDASAVDGIPEWKQVNVTLWNSSGLQNKGGDTWQGDTAGGTSTRTITSYKESCVSGCRLVVRVWAR